MFRRLCFLVVALLAILVFVDVGWAQGSTDWPDFPWQGGEHAISRGPGGYLSWLKLLPIFLLYLLWTKTIASITIRRWPFWPALRITAGL